MKTYPTEVSMIRPNVRWATWKHPYLHQLEPDWFEKELESVSRFVNRGDLALDIGAWTGDTTLPMAVAAGETGCVYAYEPNPMTYEVLLQNVLLNPHLNVEAINAAIDEKDGQATFHYSDADLCNGGLLLDVSGERIVKHESPTVVRTASFQSLGCILNESLTYIKIDTEGNDFRILKMLEPMLRTRSNMPVIKVEIFPDLSQNDRTAFYHFLKSLGLTPRFDQLDEAKESDFVAHQMIDFICTP